MPLLTPSSVKYGMSGKVLSTSCLIVDLKSNWANQDFQGESPSRLKGSTTPRPKGGATPFCPRNEFELELASAGYFPFRLPRLARGSLGSGEGTRALLYRVEDECDGPAEVGEVEGPSGVEQSEAHLPSGATRYRFLSPSYRALESAKAAGKDSSDVEPGRRP